MIETYIPLYRKYRPQQLSDLVGQEVVSTAIGNALALGKIAHAYLFCGPRGTGKTSSARILAKSLNCEQGPTATPCQTCASCASITQGSALDVTEIDAASNNGVESIRELTDKVQFSPIQGKYKIYIIDEVHMLSTAAFNALLKTLEEPPPNVVFIFATTEPHKVLPTIISRCQRFDFSRITRPQIEARLAQVAQWENIEISAEAVALIARHARGGLRDALGLLDQVAVLGKSGSGEAIQPVQVRAFIGALEEDLLFQLTEGLIHKVPETLLAQVRALQEKGVEPTQLVKELTQHFRNLLIAKACGPEASADAFDISADLYPKLVEQAQGFETEELPQILSRLALLESQLRHSHQPQLWLEVALIDLCYRVEIHLLKDLAERVAALEGGTPMTVPSKPVQAATPPAPKPMPVTPPPPAAAPVEVPPVSSAPPPVQTTAAEPSPVSPAKTPPVPSAPTPEATPVATSPAPDFGGMDYPTLWKHIMHTTQNPLVQGNLEAHFFIQEITDTAVILGYTKNKETILNTHKQAPKKQEVLEKAASTVLGRPVRVEFRLAEGPSQGTAPTPQAFASPAVASTPDKTEVSEEPPAAPEPVLVAAGNIGPDPATETPPMNLADTASHADMEQAKQYTQQLLNGKIIE